jgi:hypothetical protein
MWTPNQLTQRQIVNCMTLLLICFGYSAPLRLLVNSFVNYFDVALFQQYLDNVYYGTYSRAIQSALLCRYGSVSDSLATLACDCASATSGCYASITPNPAGIARFCSGQRANATVSKDTEPSIFCSNPCQIGGVFLQTENTVQFGQDCVDISVSTVPSFKLVSAKPKIYSSLFVQSILPSAYAVITNANGRGHVSECIVLTTLLQESWLGRFWAMFR